MSKRKDIRPLADIKANRMLNEAAAKENAAYRAKRKRAHELSMYNHEKFGLTFSQCVQMLMTSPALYGADRGQEAANRAIERHNDELIARLGSAEAAFSLRKLYSTEAWRDLYRKNFGTI